MGEFQRAVDQFMRDYPRSDIAQAHKAETALIVGLTMDQVMEIVNEANARYHAQMAEALGRIAPQITQIMTAMVPIFTQALQACSGVLAKALEDMEKANGREVPPDPHRSE